MNKKDRNRRKNDNLPVYRSFAMIMQFGINMLVPICALAFFGILLDKTLETSYWMIVLFFVGALAGGRNIYRMARQIYDRQDRSGHGEGRKGTDEREKDK